MKNDNLFNQTSSYHDERDHMMARWPHLNSCKIGAKIKALGSVSHSRIVLKLILIYFNPSCLSLPPLNVICGIMTLLSSILSTHPMVDCSHVGLAQAPSFESGTRRPVNSLATFWPSPLATDSSFFCIAREAQWALSTPCCKVKQFLPQFLRLQALMLIIFVDYLTYA